MIELADGRALQYKTLQAKTIVELITEKAHSSGERHTQTQRDTEAVRQTEAMRQDHAVAQKGLNQLSTLVSEATDTDEEQLSQAGASIDSVDADDSDQADVTNILDQKMYDVKQGRTQMQLQVGSLGLQLFKGGKLVDSVLFKDMASWIATEEMVHVDVPGSKRLSYSAVSERDADSIVAQMTATARALAKEAKRTSFSAGGSNPLESISSPALKRTSSASVDLAAAQLGTGVVQYTVKRESARGAKGGNMQLQVGTLGVQLFRGGTPVENVLLAQIKSWVRNSNSLSPSRCVCVCVCVCVCWGVG